MEKGLLYIFIKSINRKSQMQKIENLKDNPELSLNNIERNIDWRAGNLIVGAKLGSIAESISLALLRFTGKETDAEKIMKCRQQGVAVTVCMLGYEWLFIDYKGQIYYSKGDNSA